VQAFFFMCTSDFIHWVVLTDFVMVTAQPADKSCYAYIEHRNQSIKSWGYSIA